MEEIILVDEKDNEIGKGEKMQVHKDAKLHRAFSIFVFNSDGKLMIHQRNKDKYHCGGLWTNTCCSHPRAGESLDDAVKRRLQEEMGFTTDMRKVFDFIYKVKFDNGLTEHEFDHVFFGKYDDDPKPNPEEVQDWKWVDLRELRNDIDENPDKYTYWFKDIIDRVIEHIEKGNQ